MKVLVAGQQLAIRTDAKPKYVRDLAAYVSDQIEQIRRSGRTVTTQSLALLAAMNMADELYQLRDQHTRLKRQVREKTKKILRTIEKETSLYEA